MGARVGGGSTVRQVDGDGTEGRCSNGNGTSTRTTTRYLCCIALEYQAEPGGSSLSSFGDYFLVKYSRAW
jgi:hypothetical protein